MMHRSHGRGGIGGVVFCSLGSAPRAATGAKREPRRAAQAPRFEVDPLWPKPMPNRWILGSAIGVAVDSRDHVFVVNLTDSFTARTETGRHRTRRSASAASPAPNVLEFDAGGNARRSLGRPGRRATTGREPNTASRIDPKGNVWIGGAGGARHAEF